VLLRTVVEVVLDSAPVGIGGQDEPLSGRPQLFDLEAQPVERLLQRFDVGLFQGDRSPARGLPRKLSVIAPAPSRGSTPQNGVAACRRGCLPPR